MSSAEIRQFPRRNNGWTPCISAPLNAKSGIEVPNGSDSGSATDAIADSVGGNTTACTSHRKPAQKASNSITGRSTVTAQQRKTSGTINNLAPCSGPITGSNCCTAEAAGSSRSVMTM